MTNIEPGKLRILFAGEASFLSTGFSTLSLEIIKRLHATGKYVIGEMANYGSADDYRAVDLPWQYFPVLPFKHNKAEVDQFNSHILNQFGGWCFEKYLLKFRPDVVHAHLDHWMMAYQAYSPFRSFYNLTWMPTCDATGQKDEWLADYAMADAVYAYNDWSLQTLKEESNGLIKTKCAAPPGADLDTYQFIVDKKGHKQRMGLSPDIFIVGTMMRNQKRKLYPDLLKAFALFLENAPAELANKTFLYLHTTYPDLGWNIPQLINECGLARKVMLTYHCQRCNAAFPSFYQDAKGVCRVCGEFAATMPVSHAGVSRASLNQIFNLFDVYVQYSNSEGFGMPLVEAGACGVPVMAVDYSAPQDIIRKLGGYPLKVQALSREIETGCYRAIPDNAFLAQQLAEFLSLPEVIRLKKGFETRKTVEEHYTYDKTAKIWEEHFDSIKPQPHELTWNSPPRIRQPNLNIPSGFSNSDFVRWGIINIAGRPDLVTSYMAMKLTRDLNWGSTSPNIGGPLFNDDGVLGNQPKYQNFDRKSCVQQLLEINKTWNMWEERRCRQ